ncbi:hypothetical protein DV532_22195 [Pseudomonas sp. Leaf58]|uniref:hypothetical protein n=1 Tax=Pseudomonas sp. Leaf58 TaxID=1736226 RepID=UPI0006F62CD1|nr:hypothetical protein [Pseudomonas sp. Leaf58]AYG47565.1 hypothetical protein DV532_22195 [Pseudomonas sp. Leaf58]KQN67398.1 hypothetical protein ASF02_03495 [Pseudomonas sp. Leaf58]
MQANYRLWLNGNSLVLIDKAVRATRAEDLLNVQLSAFIAANNRHAVAVPEAAWHTEYLRIQGSFGCSLGTLQSCSLPQPGAAVIEPWEALQANLLAQLPSTLQAPVAECLDAFRAKPDEAVQQLLWAECVQPPDDGGYSQVHAELRLILPDSSIISTELSLNIAALLGPTWLWQALDSACVQAGRQVDVHYLTQDKLVDSIGAGLCNTLKVKRAQYRSAIRQFPDKELKHE